MALSCQSEEGTLDIGIYPSRRTGSLKAWALDYLQCDFDDAISAFQCHFLFLHLLIRVMCEGEKILQS